MSLLSQFAAGVSDTILRGADRRAQTAEDLARIQANQTAQSGQNWGRTLQQLGQIPQEIQQQRQAQQVAGEQSQIRQLEIAKGQGELSDAAKARARANALDQIYASGVFNDDGSVNETELLKRAAGAGVGAQIPALMKTLQETHKTTAETADLNARALKAANEAADAQTRHVDELATKAESYPPDQRGTALAMLIGQAAKAKAITDEQASGVLDKLWSTDDHSTPPDPALVDQAIRTMHSVANADMERKRKEALAKPVVVGRGATAVMGDTGETVATGQPIEPTPKGLQSEDVLLDGKRAKVTFDPATGIRRNAAGEDVTARVAPIPPQAADSLVKVEHRGPDGKTIIEWIPKSQLAGRTFEKGTSATLENRLASAQAVQQTGDDIIGMLDDPKTKSALGPLQGRYTSVQQFIGNPPPEFSELAGAIESYALANMGVHGMRSSQGAEQIKKMLDGRFTPDNLKGAIRGLQRFSQHFMENEGRAPTGQSNTSTSSGGSASDILDSYQEYLKGAKK